MQHKKEEFHMVVSRSSAKKKSQPPKKTNHNSSGRDFRKHNRVFESKSEREVVDFVLWIYARHEGIRFNYQTLGCMNDLMPSAFIVHPYTNSSLVVNCVTWEDVYHFFLAFKMGKKGRFFVYGIGAYRPVEILLLFRGFVPDTRHVGGRGTFTIFMDSWF